MTTIAYRDGVMVADRRCVASDVHQAERKKVEKIGGWLVGISGDLMHGSCLRSLIAEKLENDTFAEGLIGKFEWADDTYMSAIIVSPRHEIYFVENTKAGVVAAAKMGAANGFVARGSGRDFALAAMAMGADAYTAIEIASKFDVNTGDGVDVVELGVAALEPAAATAADEQRAREMIDQDNSFREYMSRPVETESFTPLDDYDQAMGDVTGEGVAEAAEQEPQSMEETAASSKLLSDDAWFTWHREPALAIGTHVEIIGAFGQPRKWVVGVEAMPFIPTAYRILSQTSETESEGLWQIHELSSDEICAVPSRAIGEAVAKWGNERFAPQDINDPVIKFVVEAWTGDEGGHAIDLEASWKTQYATNLRGEAIDWLNYPPSTDDGAASETGVRNDSPQVEGAGDRAVPQSSSILEDPDFKAAAERLERKLEEA